MASNQENFISSLDDILRGSNASLAENKENFGGRESNTGKYQPADLQAFIDLPSASCTEQNSNSEFSSDSEADQEAARINAGAIFSDNFKPTNLDFGDLDEKPLKHDSKSSSEESQSELAAAVPEKTGGSAALNDSKGSHFDVDKFLDQYRVDGSPSVGSAVPDPLKSNIRPVTDKKASSSDSESDSKSVSEEEQSKPDPPIARPDFSELPSMRAKRTSNTPSASEAGPSVTSSIESSVVRSSVASSNAAGAAPFKLAKEAEVSASSPEAPSSVAAVSEARWTGMSKADSMDRIAEESDRSLAPSLAMDAANELARLYEANGAEESITESQRDLPEDLRSVNESRTEDVEMSALKQEVPAPAQIQQTLQQNIEQLNKIKDFSDNFEIQEKLMNDVMEIEQRLSIPAPGNGRVSAAMGSGEPQSSSRQSQLEEVEEKSEEVRPFHVLDNEDSKSVSESSVSNDSYDYEDYRRQVQAALAGADVKQSSIPSSDITYSGPQSSAQQPGSVPSGAPEPAPTKPPKKSSSSLSCFAKCFGICIKPKDSSKSTSSKPATQARSSEPTDAASANHANLE